MTREKLPDTFRAKVEFTDYCWNWIGPTPRAGYGFYQSRTYRPPRTTFYAHRVSYEIFKGPIPEGLTIDHLCRNRRCVNPAHLEAVTIRENILRGIGITANNARKSKCAQGHDLSGNNLSYYGTERRCKECHRKVSREYTKKRRLRWLEN